MSNNKVRSFPIPSRPAPSGGEDNKPKAYDPDQGDDTSPMPTYAKGGNVKSCGYAQGGIVLGRTRDFMKEPDPFSARALGPNAADTKFKKMKSDPGSPQDYKKSGKGAKGKDKSLATVMPRK